MASTDAERGRYGSPSIVPAAAWLKILTGFGLAVLAIYVVLPDQGEGTTPPIRTLVGAGAIIALLTLGALAWALASDLSLPAEVAVLAVAFNGLVVLVKFVLAPKGFYEVNQSVELSGIFNVDDAVGASIAATLVFVLYLTAFVVLYRIARRRLVPATGAPSSRKWGRNLVIALLVGAVLFAVGGALVAIVAIPLIFAAAGLEYLSFVFTSSFALLIALALAGAATLASFAFTSTAERARLAGDAALLVGFFWVGLAFLALYHALWVVYVLALTATWPLKVVVPK
jgi:hypothetical protein